LNVSAADANVFGGCFYTVRDRSPLFSRQGMSEAEGTPSTQILIFFLGAICGFAALRPL
jgi:hypothetical protein